MSIPVAGAQNQDFRTIPRLWRVEPGVRALDLGAGLGLYTAELAVQGAWVVGMDLEFGPLAAARARAAGRKFFWVRGDAAHLPFRAEVFSLVVSVEVLSHLAPPVRERAVAETWRVLRDGGEVFLTWHNRARLVLGQWLRGRGAQAVYATANLPVWPATPAQARGWLLGGGFAPAGRTRYLNFHSRFTFGWWRRHPRMAQVLAAVEDLLGRLPLLRRLAITFLVPATKPAGAK